jgi:CheY-like chemotaxis protein
MARLLIVSRSMALAMRLADQHEVIEHPADDLDNLTSHLDADVLVLDVGDPVLAVNTVNSLREDDQVIPVLLVSGYQPEWEQVEAQQVDGVHVVPLPITRVALLHGVAALIGEDSAMDVDSPAEDEVPEPEPTPEPEVEQKPPVPAADPTAPSAAARDAATKAVAAKAAAAKAAAEKAAADAAAVAAAREARLAREARAAAAARKPGPNLVRDTEAERLAKASPPSSATPSSTPDTDTPDQSDEAPEVTQSGEVAGVSYSASITQPFDEQPRTGQFQMPGGPQTPSKSTRWARPGPGSTQSPGQSSGQSPSPGSGPAAGAKSTSNKPFTGIASSSAMARRMLGNRPRKLQRRPGLPEMTEPRQPTGMGLVTDPLGPRTDPYGFPASDLDRRLDADAAALVTRGAEGGFALRTAELVRMLHERAGDLYSVSDTAQVLADDVIERADADAAAILVPDGPVWRVSGGVGLRPLERRLELPESHWLITEIGAAGRAVLIEDTDIIRQQLSGAPLAAWRHLLAVPVPDVRGIVVLARGKEGGPFSDRDLSAVIAPVREAAALLAQAVQTRRLARLLDPLREVEDDSPSRPRSSD